MRLSRRTVFVLECAMAVSMVTGLASAAGSTYYDHGKPVALTDSYACTEADILNDGKLITVVAFSNGPMDKAALKAAPDPCRELRHQVGEDFPTLVENPGYLGSAASFRQASFSRSRRGVIRQRSTRFAGSPVRSSSAGSRPTARSSPICRTKTR